MARSTNLFLWCVPCNYFIECSLLCGTFHILHHGTIFFRQICSDNPPPPSKVARVTHAQGNQPNKVFWKSQQFPNTKSDAKSPALKLLFLNDETGKRSVSVQHRMMVHTQFIGKNQIMEPETKVACSHCYKEISVIG
jgi:hypothetical protein